MAANRCPHCQLPLIQTELETGKCPVCFEELENIIEVENPAPAPAPESRQPLGFLALFGIFFLAGLMGSLVTLPLGISRPGVGVGPAIMVAYGVLYGMGLVGKRKKAS